MSRPGPFSTLFDSWIPAALAPLPQNDFLTLIHLHAGPLPTRLREVKDHLCCLADEKAHQSAKAEAAFLLAQFLREYSGSAVAAATADNGTASWLEIAISYGSVEAAAELADMYLQSSGLRITVPTHDRLLPRLEPITTSEGRTIPRVPATTVEAWYSGARTAAKAAHNHYQGWSKAQYTAAFQCIANWLLFITNGATSANKERNRRRYLALMWIRPVWKRLVNSWTRHAGDMGRLRADLLLQQRAIYEHLAKQNACLEALPQADDKVAQTPVAAIRAAQVRVIRGPIAPASDKSEEPYLRLYESLRHPIPILPLPPLQQLTLVVSTLNKEFPWAHEAIQQVINSFFARLNAGSNRLGMEPTLLVGPPGTGKTRFAQRLSELLDVPSTVINLAGMTDVKTLKGVTRGWASNRPSRMIEFIQQTQTANPLFILDEVDKCHVGNSSNGGRPHDALLDLLEPTNARRYTDVFLMAEVDLSHCLYILTSNSFGSLPEPLASRVKPVLFPAPRYEDKDIIANSILRDLERAWGVGAESLALPRSTIEALADMPIRQMKRAIIDQLASDIRLAKVH